MLKGIDIGAHSSLLMVGAFLIITLILGLWAGRNVKTLKDYALANRQLGVGVLTMTFLATEIHGNYLLVITDEFASHGLPALLDNMGGNLVLIFFALFIAPKLAYYTRALTTGDIAEELFGSYARVIVGLAGTIYSIAIAAIPILVTGSISSSLLGVDKSQAILYAGGILILYSIRGGIRSVAITDIIQFAALVVVVAVLANMLLTSLGGIKSVFAKVYQAKPQHFSFTDNPSFKEHFLTAISNLIGVHFISPPYIQRMLMNKNTKKIQKMLYLGAFFSTLIFFAFMIIGFGSILIYPEVTGDELVPNLVANLFPKSMQGIFAIGILAMNMSTSDSFLNSAGLVLVHDVVKPFLDKRKIVINELKQIRVATFIIGTVTVLVAAFANAKAIPTIQIFWYGNLIFSAIFIPLVAGILGLKVNRISFMLALVTSFSILFPARLLGKGSDELYLFSMLANGVVFLFSNTIIHKGFVTIDRATQTNKHWVISWKKLDCWIKEYFPTLGNIARYSSIKVQQHGEYALTFSIFLCSSYLFPYIISNQEKFHLFNHILIIRTIGVLLCAGLMLKTVWPKGVQKKYFPLYWHFVLFYCLPFSTTLIFLLGAGSTTWPADIALTILLLILLVDWMSFFILATLGIGAAIFTYYGLFGKTPSIPDFETAYHLVITCLATTTIGFVFARKKEKFASIRFKTVSTLARFIGHEVGYLSNYTLTPSQLIQKELKEKASKKEPGDRPKDTSSPYYVIDTDTYEKITQEASTIEKGTKYLIETTKQLGSMIREYAQSLSNPIYCSIGDLVKKEVLTFPGNEERMAAITTHIEHDFHATIPKRAFTFVLHNILRNAFIHGGDDVQITITVNERSLSIKDNGKGIPPQNLDKIFEMFYTTGDQQFSTGVGLGFAKMVVEWFMGSIRCESSQMPGHSYADFIIEFPLESPHRMDENDPLSMKKKIAICLLREGVEISKIENITKLSKEQIDELKEV